MAHPLYVTCVTLEKWCDSVTLTEQNPMSRCLYISQQVVFTLLLATVQPLLAGQFTPPDLTGFVLHDERDADGDGDGVNETHIRRYRNANGDSIFSMTSKGRLWAWSLDTRDDDAGEHNYVIRDGNCDGTFDEVYSLGDEYHVPGCLK